MPSFRNVAFRVKCKLFKAVVSEALVYFKSVSSSLIHGERDSFVYAEMPLWNKIMTVRDVSLKLSLIYTNTIRTQ